MSVLTSISYVTPLSIGFVSYVNPFAHSGGGEMISQELLRAGVEAGHRIAVWSLWPTPSMPDIDQVNGWILVDVLNVPEHWKRWHQRILRLVPGSVARKYRRVLRRAMAERFIHLDNAYVDTCSRPYLPCNGATSLMDCPYEIHAGKFKEMSTQLYVGAEACFFLSPLHEKVLRTLQPGIRKSYVLRPTLDPKRFSDGERAANRDIEWLYVGSLVEAKGVDELANLDQLTAIAPREGALSLPKATMLEGIPPEEMHSYYKRAKRFIFKPRWPEPFGRVVAEAALSGCKLHVNDRVGAMTFDRHPSDESLYEGAAREFWDRVSEILRS